MLLLPTSPVQVMPFIQANINKNTAPEDWRLREAATFAFGLVLDGPNPAALTDTVKQALAYLLQVRAQRSVAVGTGDLGVEG